MAASLCLVLGASPAFALLPSAPDEVHQEALHLAFWRFPTGEPHVYKALGGIYFSTEDVASGQHRILAGIALLKCRDTKVKHGTRTSCEFLSGTGPYKGDPLTSDPLLTSARLELKDDHGAPVAIEWTGVDHGWYEAQEFCSTWTSGGGEPEEGEGSGAGHWVDSTATFEGFKDVPQKKAEFAIMTSGVMLTSCSMVRQRELNLLEEGRMGDAMVRVVERLAERSSEF
ncbi:MAG: hypothetical protein QOG54_2593 [Actinomycetota bacterium]|nr:hypothetical protein [Actinomycetota bacterium]